MQDLQALLRKVEKELSTFGCVEQEHISLGDASLPGNISLSTQPSDYRELWGYLQHLQEGGYDLTSISFGYKERKRVIDITCRGTHHERKEKMLRALRVLKKGITNYGKIKGRHLRVA